MCLNAYACVWMRVLSCVCVRVCFEQKQTMCRPVQPLAWVLLGLRMTFATQRMSPPSSEQTTARMMMRAWASMRVMTPVTIRLAHRRCQHALEGTGLLTAVLLFTQQAVNVPQPRFWMRRSALTAAT